MDGAATEAQLKDLVTRFYGKARCDPRLGPIFEAHVADWDAHIETLTRFWSSVMLTSGLYKGNPFSAHFPLAPQLDDALFNRWLALWAEAADEIFPADIASALKLKAQRIASSLRAGLLFRCGDQTKPAPPDRAGATSPLGALQ